MTPASSGGHRLAIFTICSNNYMPFAQVLFDSVRRHHPEAALFLCLADRLPDTPSRFVRDWTVIEAHDLSIPDFPSFAFRYDIMEFNTALKPFMFLHLLDDRGFDAAIYFDPDIEVFAPLAGVVAALQGGASFLFTPHLCAPNERRQEPNDLMIMRAGAYNLGFLAVTRSEETTELLGWWARRLRYQCINAQAEGIFVDQKFMDLVPGFAPNVAISHDTTLNVAYWNLEQRALAQTAEGWTVDGAPLTFFHFSGFDPRLPNRLSKHDPRFVGDLPPPLSTLITHYAERLWAEGYGTVPGASYAYGRFASGTPIHPAIRTMFRDWHPFWGGDPFREYEAFLHEIWPESGRGEPGHAATNFMRFLQDIVPQLSNLDLRKPEDAESVVRWFVTDAPDALGLDPALVQPVAARLGELRAAPSVIPVRSEAAEMDVTLTVPLRTSGEAEESGHLAFGALIASNLAVEMRDGSTLDGFSPGNAPVEIICLAADRMAEALPRRVSLGGDAFRVLVPVWDLARFPEVALSALGLVHEIWAPSRFIQLALAGRTNRPVIHMPLAVEVESVVTLPRSAFGIPEDRFAFLSFFTGRPSLDRTDPRIAIHAFRQAFPQRGKACLVLASPDSSVTHEQRHAIAAEIGDDPDILLLDRRLTSAQKGSLMAACDAVLSLYRSQGLGLSISRAMLLELPVIATRYSASAELVTDQTGFPVDYRLVPAADGALQPAQNWAEIDTAHAASIMTCLAENPQRAVPLVAQAREHVRHTHGREAVAARQKARLVALGMRPT
jgi:glycosyltransferase involved in cell wall biosynthesis